VVKEFLDNDTPEEHGNYLISVQGDLNIRTVWEIPLLLKKVMCRHDVAGTGCFSISDTTRTKIEEVEVFCDLGNSKNTKV